MKKLFLAVIALGFFASLKAQQLKSFTPSDSLLNQSINRYFQSGRGNQLQQPEHSIARAMAMLNADKNTNVITSTVDHMPIAVLGGNYKMPIVKLNGNSRMPVLPLGPPPVSGRKQTKTTIPDYKFPAVIKIPGK